MGYTALTLGTTANDGTGEGLRAGGVKINAMFTELYAYRLDQWAAPTNAVSLNAQKITNLATPTNSGDAATKAYVDAIIAASDAMVFKGVVDCSTNPNYPAADRGHTYRASVAGKIGGASGVNVEVGDLLTCITDSTSSGTHASVGANWTIGQTNIDGAVVGPSSATDGYVAVFDGTSGKLIKSGAIAISALAPLASPTFTGTPTAPTATGGTNTTQVATTAFVRATKLNELAAPSADVAMNSNKITGLADPASAQDAATKAYVDSAGGGGGGVSTSADYTWTGSHSFGKQVAIASDLSPLQITSDQNNYDPANLSTAAILRIDTDANRSLTGLAGGADGRVMVLRNVGFYVIRLKDENASSTAANRFAFGADLFVAPKKSVVLCYDATLSRWIAAARFSEPYGVFRAHRNGTDQTGLTSGVYSRISLTHETLDPDGVFDNATNYRYQPKIEGYYWINAMIGAASNNESPAVQIYKNGAGYGLGGNYLPAGAGSGYFVSSQADLIYFNGTTDYVDARVYLPSGVTSVSGSSFLTGYLMKGA